MTKKADILMFEAENFLKKIFEHEKTKKYYWKNYWKMALNI